MLSEIKTTQSDWNFQSLVFIIHTDRFNNKISILSAHIYSWTPHVFYKK
jgi:hypothetical protein